MDPPLAREPTITLTRYAIISPKAALTRRAIPVLSVIRKTDWVRIHVSCRSNKNSRERAIDIDSLTAGRRGGVHPAKVRSIGDFELDGESVNRLIAWTLFALVLSNVGSALARDAAIGEGSLDGAGVGQSSGLKGKSCEKDVGGQLRID